MKTIILFLIVFLISTNIFSQLSRNWVTITSSPGTKSDDRAFKVAMDNAGNTYVTGQCHSSDGTFGIGTIKYNSAGVLQWFSHYQGSPNDSATGIAIDNENNIYVCGKYYNTSQGYYYYILLKYEPINGVMQWASTYNGQAGGDAVATAVAVDNDVTNGPFVYVTGYSYEIHSSGYYSPYNYDMVTIKYRTSDGSTVWPSPNKFDAPDEDYPQPPPPAHFYGHGDDKAFSISVVPQTNSNNAVYICGYSFHDYFVNNTHYIQNNNMLVQIDIVSGGSDVPPIYSYYVPGYITNTTDAGVAVVASQLTDKVYYTGYKHKDNDPNQTDLFLLQNKRGLYNDPQYNDCHQCEDFCASYADNTAQHTTDCGETYANDYGSDYGTSLAINDNSNAGNIIIYVCGASPRVAQNNLEFVTLKYHGSVNQAYCQYDPNYPDHYPYDAVAFYNASCNNAVAHGIVIGPSNYVFVCGTAYESARHTCNPRFTVIQYDQNLNQMGFDQYVNGLNTNSGEAFGIASNGNTVSATGYNFDSPGSYDFNYITINYSITNQGSHPANVSSNNLKEVNNYLFQNYPNPFNPETRITYSIKNSSFVNITIFDILGKKIATLVNTEMERGEHYITWNASNYASGIYYYKITTSDFTDIKKLLLIK